MKDVRWLAALVMGVATIAFVYSLAVGGRAQRAAVDDPGERVTRYMVVGDRGEFLLSGDGRIISAEWRGDFDLNALETDIATLENRLGITLEENGAQERAEFRREGGRVTHAYFLNGEEQEDNAQTQSKIADLLLLFLRASGRKARERVAAIMEKGGIDAVLEEIEMVVGDHATGRYVMALTAETELSPSAFARVMDKLETIENDHDLARALTMISRNEQINAETASALVDAAASIRNGNDLRQLAVAFAQKPLDEESVSLALGLIERIDGEHDFRVAATAFLERGALNGAQAARLLSAARRLDSDFELSLLLTKAAPYYAASEAAGAAWRDAFARLDSPQDMRRALEEVARAGGLEDRQWNTLMDAAQVIDSSEDRRLALEAIAAHRGGGGAAQGASRDDREGVIGAANGD